MSVKQCYLPIQHGSTHNMLLQALEKFGIKDNTQELLEVADQNGDGQIDYQEFVLLMRETNKELKAATAANDGNSGLLRGRLQIT
jgi:Ca2+-binding EF-hand superfamily protein